MATGLIQWTFGHLRAWNCGCRQVLKLDGATPQTKPRKRKVMVLIIEI